MALYCPTNLTAADVGFQEFLECNTVSINIDVMGICTVNFTVVSISATPLGTYTTMTFGGVVFTGFITNLEVAKLPGTLIFEHRYTLTSYACSP